MPNILEEIKSLREAIRYHRDQKGDDRCWLDDDRLRKLLPDSPPTLRKLPAFPEMMKRCTAFYRYRRADTADLIHSESITDPLTWDSDLESLDEPSLIKERERTQEAIRFHRDIIDRERTLADDRILYEALPEKLPADFRLPSEPEFLGEARAPRAGCPSFWRSHERYASDAHDLHHWGPCES